MRGARGAQLSPELEALALPTADLFEDEDNVRVHGSASIDAIIASLDRFGQQKPIVVIADAEHGRYKVIAGNGTFRAARALGWDRLAATVWDGAAGEARKFGIADNRLGELSEWNREVLARQVGTLASTDIDLALHVGFSQGEIEALVRAIKGEEETQIGDAPGIRSGLDTPKHERERRSKIQVAVVEFSTDAQQDVWGRFLGRLRALHPDRPNLGARLASYVRDLADVAAA